MGKQGEEPRRSGRKHHPYERPGMATEKQILRADPNIDSLPITEEESDDRDWLSASDLEGRPATFSGTWGAVYRPLKKETLNGRAVSSIDCREKNCKDKIYISGTLKELSQNGNDLLRALKPPICHIVPWVMINYVIKLWDNDPVNGGKMCSEEFRRFACWGITTNLRPGHAACNLAGRKTTATWFTAGELADAEAHFDKAKNAYLRPVWL